MSWWHWNDKVADAPLDQVKTIEGRQWVYGEGFAKFS